jgi:hypothetical protein
MPLPHHPKKYATTTRKGGETITIYVFTCSCVDKATQAPLKKSFKSRSARDRYAEEH